MKINHLSFLLLLFLFCFLSFDTLCQSKIHIGFITGLKVGFNDYEDEGSRLFDARLPRLKLGVLGTYQFHKRFAVEVGINSDNVGLDVNYRIQLSRSRFFNQGITKIEIPIRLKTKLLSIAHDKFQFQALTGISYHYNWNLQEQPDSEGTILAGSTIIKDSYSLQALKRHAFLLDYGFQLNWQLKRLNFFLNKYWQAGFTPIAEKVGQYTIDGGQPYDFTISTKGSASVWMFGAQYRINVRNKKIYEYTSRRERLGAVPDSLRNWDYFFSRNRFALVFGSPLFIPRNESKSGEGDFKYLPAPGFMVGLDYYWHFNPILSLRAGIRGGFQHYVYNYNIKGSAIGKEQNFVGSSSAENGFASIPLQLQARKILNKSQYIGVGVGVSANFFVKDTIAYIQPKEAEFPDLLINSHSFNAPNPSFTPSINISYAKMMRSGNVWQIDLRYQQGFSKIMEGNYQFLNRSNNSIAGEGRFMSRDSFIGLELSYHFNALRRHNP